MLSKYLLSECTGKSNFNAVHTKHNSRAKTNIQHVTCCLPETREKTRITQTTPSQDWWVTIDPKAQAVMPRLHETGLGESNQESEVDPFTLENKKLHPLESHLRKKRKFYHQKLQPIGKHLKVSSLAFSY